MSALFDIKTKTITVHGDRVGLHEMRVLLVLAAINVPAAIPAIQNHLDPPITYQSLYALLKRLRYRELVSGTRVSVDGPLRRKSLVVWTLSEPAYAFCRAIQSTHDDAK